MAKHCNKDNGCLKSILKQSSVVYSKRERESQVKKQMAGGECVRETYLAHLQHILLLRVILQDHLLDIRSFTVFVQWIRDNELEVLDRCHVSTTFEIDET
jgi:hypothetical protein